MDHISLEWLIRAMRMHPSVRMNMLSERGCILGMSDGTEYYVVRLLPDGDPLSPFSDREPTLVIRDVRREPA